LIPIRILKSKLANLDSKDQNHIVDMVKEVIKDLTENELLRVNPNSTVSLTTDGMSYVLSALPKNFF
jgi:predicted transcriptional regulator